MDLDSNTVERSIRPLAQNRKNALFAGSDEGGYNWAVTATLIECCKLNAINPHQWLTETLSLLANGHPASNDFTRDAAAAEDAASLRQDSARGRAVANLPAIGNRGNRAFRPIKLHGSTNYNSINSYTTAYRKNVSADKPAPACSRC